MANLENISTEDLRQILAEVDDGAAVQRLMAAITYKEIDDLTQKAAAELYGFSESWASKWFNRLERLETEPFETRESLRGPAFGESVEFGGGFLGEIIDLFVGDRCHQPLYRSPVIDLRQDLAEVFGRDVLQIRHADSSDSISMSF